MPIRIQYFHALTGMRAIAAYLVFLHHFNPAPIGSLAWGLLNEGHIGVTIFFVLSGFLIPHRYLGQVTFSRQWLQRYFVNRFARIYPLYALLTLVTFLAINLSPGLDPIAEWWQYGASDKVLVPLLNLTFLRGLFEQFKFSGVSQGWSLTVEECFYLTAIPLLIVVARSERKYLTLVLAGLGIATLGYLLVTVAPHPYGFFGSYRFMFFYTFFGRVTEFMIGAALALVVRQGIAVRAGTLATTLGVAWVLSSLIGLYLLATPALPSWENPVGVALNNLWLPPGIALLFYGLLTERTWLAQLLSSPAAQTAGKSSYAFYLVHLGLLGSAVYSYFLRTPGAILLHFVLALVVAYLVWKYIEEPLNRWIRGRMA